MYDAVLHSAPGTMASVRLRRITPYCMYRTTDGCILPSPGLFRSWLISLQQTDVTPSIVRFALTPHLTSPSSPSVTLFFLLSPCCGHPLCAWLCLDFWKTRFVCCFVVVFDQPSFLAGWLSLWSWNPPFASTLLNQQLLDTNTSYKHPTI